VPVLAEALDLLDTGSHPKSHEVQTPPVVSTLHPPLDGALIGQDSHSASHSPTSP
jgi:hypothetical protein